MSRLLDGDSEHVFHITQEQAWRAAQAAGRYIPAGFESEGFIHFSYARQMRATARRYYLHQDGLLLLRVARSAIDGQLKDENLLGGAELFPHLYAPLDVAAVLEIARIGWTPEGDILLTPASPDLFDATA